MERIIPVRLILAVSVIQGLLLFALYNAVEQRLWPSGDTVSLYLFTTLAVSIPVLIALSGWSNNPRHLSRWLVPFVIGLALVASYVGYQLQPVEVIRGGFIHFSFVVTIAIACFKALMYIQHQDEGKPISYSELFVHSWRNFLVLGLAALFVLVFSGILTLWAGLFNIIGIVFFEKLFTSAWFYFPVLCVAGGVAIIIFRNKISIIDTIAQLLQALIKYLLPLVVLVEVLFLVALLFSGLDLLWKTGTGSQMILWLLAITLFFVNAVYQDKSDVIPYPLAVHRFVYTGIALLPVYSLIAAYGLYLRIDQYGFTIGRSWGVLICLLLTLFAVGYLWGIVKKRDNWIETLSSVNVAMGLVVLLVMLLINSPLLDFRKISVNSQMARVASGMTALKDLDVWYFQRNLARPGYLALQELKSTIGESNPEIVQRIDSAYYKETEVAELDIHTLEEMITTYPENCEIPPELLAKLLEKISNNKWERRNILGYYLIKQNLNEDDKPEYVWIKDKGNWGTAELWYQTDKGWEFLSMGITGDWRKSNMKQWLKDDELTLLPQRWKRLRIGEMIFKVYDE